MHQLEPILAGFGLTDSECAVYLALMERGSATASEIATTCELSRQSTYLALQHLQEEQLISKSTVENSPLFHCEPISALTAFASRHEHAVAERVHSLRAILPELELLIGKEKPAIKIFEGREGILATLAELKRADANDIYEIADVATLNSIFSPEDLRPLHTETKRSLTVRGLYRLAPGGNLTNPLAQQLPAETPAFRGNVSVFGDTTILVSLDGKMHSVIIHSQSIADTMRLLFSRANLAESSESC